MAKRDFPDDYRYSPTFSVHAHKRPIVSSSRPNSQPLENELYILAPLAVWLDVSLFISWIKYTVDLKIEQKTQRCHLFIPMTTAHLAYMSKRFSRFQVYFLVMWPSQCTDSAHRLYTVMMSWILKCFSRPKKSYTNKKKKSIENV